MTDEQKATEMLSALRALGHVEFEPTQVGFDRGLFVTPAGGVGTPMDFREAWLWASGFSAGLAHAPNRVLVWFDHVGSYCRPVADEAEAQTFLNLNADPDCGKAYLAEAPAAGPWWVTELEPADLLTCAMCENEVAEVGLDLCPACEADADEEEEADRAHDAV